jgi:hypothetical protein
MQGRANFFQEIVLADFEFHQPPGELPSPVCLVAMELNRGVKHRIWMDELAILKEPPYQTGPDCLFVAYYASAELGCYLSLGWEMPENVLDLYTEFRLLTNGRSVPAGNGLIGALTFFGHDSLEATIKESFRDLVMRGGPWSNVEKQDILDYCETDVVALEKLFSSMQSKIDFNRALLRGRYMKAAAVIERTGIPIDTPTLQVLRDNWDDIQENLIQRVDSQYGVFEDRAFKTKLWEAWVSKHQLPWPVLESGRLDLKDNTFKDMARSFPEVAPMRELRATLSKMRLTGLAVGHDGRNRCLLSAFKAITGRNQPSNTASVFGPAVWLRSLIKPEPGFGLAYIDWSQQEFGIAAALSEDPKMMAAYQSGDPYLAFAKQAGAVPADANKATHGHIRERFKQCVLGVQYGMGAKTLSQRIGQPLEAAKRLLTLHRQTYPTFWQWSEGVLDYAFLRHRLWTVFGWHVFMKPDQKAGFIRNFPMQANGAEILRLACCLAVEKGIHVCIPVHDAILIEAPLDSLADVITQAQGAMAAASGTILNGFKLNSDVKAVYYPERYEDDRGRVMWNTVMNILSKLST